MKQTITTPYGEKTSDEMIEAINNYRKVVDVAFGKWSKQSANPTTIEWGKRYGKVRVGYGTPLGNHHGWVHTFVDITNGDILKAASYKAPAKNGVRGNIFAPDHGASVINWHGALLLK